MKKDRVQDKFLDALKKVPIVLIACNKCSISRNSIYRWRREDPEFASLMDNALAEGEEYINDLSESQLLTLIKEKHFSAIKFWLIYHHSKYKKQEEELRTVTRDDSDSNLIIKKLGLTPEDFADERIDETKKIINDYLENQ